MSTAERVRVEPERCVAFRTTWEGYQALTRIVDEGDNHVRIAFDGRMAELMSPGSPHERDRIRLERIIEILADERGLPYQPMGSTRWDRPEAERGLEPDACFYLTAEKIADSGGRTDAECPVPDIAVEIDHRASQIDRDSIYEALGVPEVWSFDGEGLAIEVLSPAGRHDRVASSPSLGVSAAEVAAWMLRGRSEDFLDWARGFRAWVRAGLGR